MASPAAFAESTISAVQAALHKYQSMIHELQVRRYQGNELGGHQRACFQVKLQSNREQLLLVRKQFDNSEENVGGLENRVKELVAQLDACRTQCSQLAQDKEYLQKSLDTLKTEKNALDRHRIEINALVESLNADYDKLQKNNNKLQKEVDGLQDERIFLQTEIERLNQEASIREINLRGEEERCSRIREELLTTREELHKMYLSHDMLEQQKAEAENLISSLEKSKGMVWGLWKNCGLIYDFRRLRNGTGENFGREDQRTRLSDEEREHRGKSRE
jgi:rootletin